MKHILLVPNTQKDKELAVTKQVAACIADRAKLFLHEDYRGFGVEAAGFRAPDEVYSGIDCIIVLGGDGTLLGVAREAAAHKIPILGINLGRLGFLAEVERHEIEACLDKLLAGAYTVENRMMIHAVIRKASGSTAAFDALNDIVIAKGTAFRVVRVGISADGEEVTRFNGDGVIAATPTGSTAYGLSAGGPVIEPSAENLAVIPICAHALAAKSFVFAPERTLAITARCEGGSEVFISADGGQGFAVRPDDRVLITRSALRTRLIRLKGNSFYRILQQKL